MVTGRSLYQFNAGTMTLRTPLVEMRPDDVLEIAPVEACRLNLQDGDLVTVTSRYGEALLPVRRSSMVAPGQAFATFHTPRVFLNNLTGPNRDPTVGTPEYKLTAVRLKRQSSSAIPPS